MCHTVLGTRAAATVGPDLTHLASRMTLASATVDRTREHLRQWLVDAQGIKPGSRMPPLPLPPADVEALVSYMETLR
jgi:cytochrome c oxidase subunit 2